VRPAVEATGTQLAFVHAATPEDADPWFERSGLGDVPRVSDIGLAHYRAFGLATTGFGELLDPRLWLRGASCALSQGFGPQTAQLLKQLPGVFVIRGRNILAAYRHRSPADRPNYLDLVAASSGITMR
jgi:hypothetical protein